MAVGFDFTCLQPSVGFDEKFRVGGDVDDFSWRDRDWPGHATPDLRGRKLSWRVEADKLIFESYAEVVSNLGGSISPESAHVEYWSSRARGMLWAYERDHLQITLAVPPGHGFASFITSIVSGGMGLKVRLPLISFAEREDAPAPTVSSFLSGARPAFFTEYALFSPLPHQPVASANEDEPRSRRGLLW